MTTYRYYTISPRIDDTGKHYAAIYDAIKRPVTETIRCDNEAAAIQAAKNYIDSLLDGPVSKVNPELANDGLRQIVIEQNHDLAALRRQVAERDERIAELNARIERRNNALRKMQASMDQCDARIAELESLLINFHRNTTPTDKPLTIGQYEFKIATIHGLAYEALKSEVK